MQLHKRLFGYLPIMAFLSLGIFAATHANAQSAQGSPGAVFVATNSERGNSVIMYERAPNGRLRRVGRYPTGGRGEGGVNDPLQAQNSLVLNADHSYLLAANAGSGEISVFKVNQYGLALVSVTPSGGGNPISVAIHDDLVYVLNAAGNLNTSGFRLRPWGGLTRISNSRLPLSGPDRGASTISFSPDGNKLVITERLTNKIDVFSVTAEGGLSNPVFNSSVGNTPFGFQFTPAGALLVTEANGGFPNPSSTSSYLINSDNTLSVVTSQASSSGSSACWLVTDGSRAWVSNASVGSIGAYSVDTSGALTAAGVAAQEPPLPGSNLTSSFPLDLALSSDNRFVYVLYSALGRVVSYKIEEKGPLTPIDSTPAGQPSDGVEGLAAY